jgi:hypothetical protein
MRLVVAGTVFLFGCGKIDKSKEALEGTATQIETGIKIRSPQSCSFERAKEMIQTRRVAGCEGRV